MTKTFFIPNKQSILGEQEILTAKSMLALVDGLESHSSVSLLTVSSISSVR